MHFHQPDYQNDLNKKQRPALEGKLDDQEVNEGFRKIAFSKHQEAHDDGLEMDDIVPVDEDQLPKKMLHHPEQEPEEDYVAKEEHNQQEPQSQNYSTEEIGKSNAPPGTHGTFFCKKCQGALFEIAVKNNHAMQLMTSYIGEDERAIINEAAQSYEQNNPDGSYSSKEETSYNPLTGTEEYQ